MSNTNTLIAYVSHSGSTQEIAEFMGRELASQGMNVAVRTMSNAGDLSSFDFIIAGGLVYRFGWHPEAIRFLQKNAVVLQAKKVALFVVGLRLVRTPDCDRTAFPIFIDPAILKGPGEPKNLMDSVTTMKAYLRAAFPTIGLIDPLSLAFFAGRLDLRVLGFSEKLIMLLLMGLMGKRSGDYRNWEAIRAWVNSLGIVDANTGQPTPAPLAKKLETLWA
jgi:menaquinone-dependent protoporphyrinogen IX oxidase